MTLLLLGVLNSRITKIAVAVCLADNDGVTVEKCGAISVSPSMTKSWLEVFAVALLLALSIVLMTVFNNAVIGGGTTVVDVAQYGEMVPELLVLHLVVWPVITVGLYKWYGRG